jgi:hypothetical protein
MQTESSVQSRSAYALRDSGVTSPPNCAVRVVGKMKKSLEILFQNIIF